MRQLQIGRQSAGFISRGHPWVRPDRFTRGLERLQLGEAVTLVDEHGQGLASALVEPKGKVCARVYDRRPGQALDPVARFAKALERRAKLLADSGTDTVRLIHGEADGLPGLRIERLGSVTVVVVFSACIQAHLPVLLEHLKKNSPGPIVVKEHIDDLQRSACQAYRLDGKSCDPEETVVVKELGVSLLVRPFGGLATGIYLDQRGTRRWLRQKAKDRRVLNLFAYTGLFSLSLLEAGAAHATDVDLAATALGQGNQNAQSLNLHKRLSQVKADCQEFLANDKDFYDLIIIDPPTAAQGGKGWILRRDYPLVIQAAAARLNPGGLIVTIANTLHAQTPDLKGLLGQSGLKIHQELPRLDEDLPQLKGFDEGRPFRLAIAEKPRL